VCVCVRVCVCERVCLQVHASKDEVETLKLFGKITRARGCVKVFSWFLKDLSNLTFWEREITFLVFFTSEVSSSLPLSSSTYYTDTRRSSKTPTPLIPAILTRSRAVVCKRPSLSRARLNVNWRTCPFLFFLLLMLLLIILLLFSFTGPPPPDHLHLLPLLSHSLSTLAVCGCSLDGFDVRASFTVRGRVIQKLVHLLAVFIDHRFHRVLCRFQFAVSFRFQVVRLFLL